MRDFTPRVNGLAFVDVETEKLKLAKTHLATHAPAATAQPERRAFS